MQQALGWGRSYISQLLTRQKSLRVEQVLLILNVIGIEPVEFYAELYTPPVPPYATVRPDQPAGHSGRVEAQQRQLEELRAQVHGLLGLLIKKRVVSGEELSP